MYPDLWKFDRKEKFNPIQWQPGPKECTLHNRVVLSKKLNLHFLFLICSLGYNNKGFSSKTCFLNIEKILEEIV